jgi:hypothetical protein
MLKPIFPQVTVEDARRLLGIEAGRFLISYIDIT